MRSPALSYFMRDQHSRNITNIHSIELVPFIKTCAEFLTIVAILILMGWAATVDQPDNYPFVDKEGLTIAQRLYMEGK